MSSSSGKRKRKVVEEESVETLSAMDNKIRRKDTEGSLLVAMLGGAHHGVFLESSGWVARGSYMRKQQYLGTFDTPEEAAAAVQQFETTGEKRVDGRRKALAPASGYRGVLIKGNRWQAIVRKHGKKHYLGTFDSPEDASAAVVHFESTGEKSTAIRPKAAASGYRGVYANNNRWAASGSFGGTRTYLGTFNTAKEASDCVTRFEIDGIKPPGLERHKIVYSDESEEIEREEEDPDERSLDPEEEGQQEQLE